MGNASKAVWSTALQNSFPDSSFLYIAPGGTKDGDGKTTPRSLRHFVYKDASGKVDLPHLRNSIARIPQSNAPGLDDAKKKALQEKARGILEKEQSGGKAISLDDRADLVEDAVEALLGIPDPDDMPMGYGMGGDDDEECDNDIDDADEDRCVEVYDDVVIICAEGAYWQADYALDMATGAVEIAPRQDWIQVEQQWTPTKAYAAKAGARHSGTDMQAIQAIHDHAAALGASCATGKSAPQGFGGRPVKALGRNRVGEYGILWGDASRKDVTGEYFTRDTQELTAIFKAMGKVPALYHHAMDGAVKSSVVGVIDVMQADDLGVWVEAQLDMGNKYAAAVQKLVEQGKLHWSSGSLPGARKAAGDGRIERWTICEMSLTPAPAEYRMLERPITEIKSHFDAIGLSFQPEAKGQDNVELYDRVARERGLRLLDLLELETV